MDSVIGLFESPDAGAQALRDLVARGVDPHTMGFTLLNPAREEAIARSTGVSPQEEVPEALSRTVTGTFWGTVAGVLLMLPTWLATWLWPEANAYHVGGLLAMLFGAIGGALTGYLFGALHDRSEIDDIRALQRLGMPAEMARHVNRALRAGFMMVLVRDQDPQTAREATEVLRAHGAVPPERAGLPTPSAPQPSQAQPTQPLA